MVLAPVVRNSDHSVMSSGCLPSPLPVYLTRWMAIYEIILYYIELYKGGWTSLMNADVPMMASLRIDSVLEKRIKGGKWRLVLYIGIKLIKKL